MPTFAEFCALGPTRLLAFFVLFGEYSLITLIQIELSCIIENDQQQWRCKKASFCTGVSWEGVGWARLKHISRQMGFIIHDLLSTKRMLLLVAALWFLHLC